MNYVIWHAPRTGSNMLCNYLSQHGAAGFASYEDAGFFVGHGPVAPRDWKKATDDYLDKMRTPNGVAGTKASFEYFDDMQPHIGFNGVKYALSQFDRHVVLDRADPVAQAVSFIFAAHTKRFTSEADGLGDASLPDYDAAYISYTIARMKTYTSRIRIYLKYAGIPYFPMLYENVVSSPRYELNLLLAWLNLPEFPPDAPLPEPTIKKQSHPLKTQWVARYKKESNYDL